MPNDDLFMDVVYDDVDHKYEQKDSHAQVITQNAYKIEPHVEPDISKVDDKEIIDERLRFLKKNIITEIEIGVLFIILAFTALMTAYEILHISIIKQMLTWIFILCVIVIVIYFIVALVRINKVKHSIKK